MIIYLVFKLCVLNIKLCVPTRLSETMRLSEATRQKNRAYFITYFLY